MSGRVELWLYIAQRLSAMVLAPLVLLHLATIVYVVQGGLSAGEILARTRGSLFWAGAYGLFVVAAAIHGTIGLHTIIIESTGRRGAIPGTVAALFAAAVLVLGFRAIGAVT